jgi:hypothetical protein
LTPSAAYNRVQARRLLAALQKHSRLSDTERARLGDPLALALATEILLLDAATWADGLTGTPEALVSIGHLRTLLFTVLALYLREGGDPLPELRRSAENEARLGDAVDRPWVTLGDVVHRVEAALREDGAG